MICYFSIFIVACRELERQGKDNISKTLEWAFTFRTLGCNKTFRYMPFNPLVMNGFYNTIHLHLLQYTYILAHDLKPKSPAPHSKPLYLIRNDSRQRKGYQIINKIFLFTIFL